MNRRITMDNCPNLRHLGGYQSRTGGKVKHNRLFRSGSLANLSDLDMERLESLDLSVVIDFRRESEIHHNPNRLPEPLMARQKQLCITPGSLIDAFGKQSADSMSQHMIQINKSLVLEHRAPYSTFLNELLDLSDGGILFHCTAGKDRTGFAAALILMALEVPREVIIEDYLLTAEYFVPEVQAPIFMEKIHEYSVTTNVLKESLIPMLSVKREYLQSAFDTIDANFGNESDYLSELFGFDREKQKSLQGKYLN